MKEGTYDEVGGWVGDALQVRPGAELALRAYVHNGAADLPETVARETRMTIDLPTCAGKSIAITSRISAANTTPSAVWDSVVLKSPTPFRMEMVLGSARLLTVPNPADGLLLPDRIGTSGGALIGSHKADGNFGGNYNNTAIVTMRVRILPAT
ncbi:hypothetical protein [Nocardia shimofusensis]|uniref:hypothetical protein n=1 Tax=Nocardia shimofusensis TaxID=228596 RepID=UPI0008360236|nr:hypothetical protein [Nocardia shimofusensis]